MLDVYTRGPEALRTAHYQAGDDWKRLCALLKTLLHRIQFQTGGGSGRKQRDCDRYGRYEEDLLYQVLQLSFKLNHMHAELKNIEDDCFQRLGQLGIDY